jgi:hypothetical protein
MGEKKKMQALHPLNHLTSLEINGTTFFHIPEMCTNLASPSRNKDSWFQNPILIGQTPPRNHSVLWKQRTECWQTAFFSTRNNGFIRQEKGIQKQ